MYLARQERVFGDVGSPRVLVKGEEEEPNHPDDDAEEGKEVGQADEEMVRVEMEFAWHFGLC